MWQFHARGVGLLHHRDDLGCGDVGRLVGGDGHLGVADGLQRELLRACRRVQCRADGQRRGVGRQLPCLEFACGELSGDGIDHGQQHVRFHCDVGVQHPFAVVHLRQRRRHQGRCCEELPAKVGSWVKAAGSGPGTIYNKGNSSVIRSFLAGSDYAAISTNVTNSRTKVGTGVCGSTSVASSLTSYLKAADGVLNVSSDAGDTPLVALVDFLDQLTTALGKS